MTETKTKYECGCEVGMTEFGEISSLYLCDKHKVVRKQSE